MCEQDGTKKFDRGEQRHLFEKAVRGNDADVDNFIVNNTRLVSSVVGSFLETRYKAQYLFDDMFSAGLLALTRATKVAVKKVREYNEEQLQEIFNQWGEDGDALSVPPYLYVAIYRDIRDVYERDSLEPMTKRRRKALRNQMGTLTRKINVGEFFYKMAEDNMLTYTESLEEILSIARTDEERLLMKLRLTHNDREITEIIGMSRIGIGRLRDKLHKRLCKDYGYDYPVRTHSKNSS